MFSKIGFSRPSPFELANASSFGDPDWWLVIRRKPGRITAATPCARMGLTTRDNPNDWAQPNHSEEMQLMARALLLGLPDGTYTSEQIAALIPDTLF